MKKTGLVLMIFLMLFSMMAVQGAAYDKEISVYLDAQKVSFDVKPQIINGRTMVPIRAIFEEMGATVVWDGASRTAVCTKGDTVVKMTVDSQTMYINDQAVLMDVSPVVIDGRTLAPARYVAEAFEADVQWSSKNNTVIIGSKDVYAYADFPDIPDLGRCYDIHAISETQNDEYYIFTYHYEDMTEDEYYSYLYDHSALVLGGYKEEVLDSGDGIVMITYTKQGETVPRYYVGGSVEADGSMVFAVLIPREYEVEAYVTLYALDGRTIQVAESEVEAYLNVGWYESLDETQQTLYAADGRTITVFKADVPAYKEVGWYETRQEAMAANAPVNKPTETYNPSADGQYYRTPTGKKYHLDPNCGGKNSYATTDISGLSPCAKCAK